MENKLGRLIGLYVADSLMKPFRLSRE